MVGPSQHDNAVKHAPQFSTTLASEKTRMNRHGKRNRAILHLLHRCPG